MKKFSVDGFFEVVEVELKKRFASYKTEILLQSEKSLKANFRFSSKLFLAVRYNSRNGRMDFALIKNNRRIFGYDNLKQWHVHPYENPDEHVPCEKPGIDKIIADVKSITDKIAK